MHERPATRADLAAVVELWSRYEEATSGAAETDEDEVCRGWDAPGFDLSRSTRLLEEGGAVVGYAVVDAQGGCDSVVALSRAGERLEERLLGWLEQHPGALTHYWGAEDQAAQERFSRRGWLAARTYWRMRRELDRPTPAPAWPTGVTVRALDAGRDGVAVHDLVETAFADVGDGRARQDFGAWAAAMLAPEHPRDGLNLLAEQDGVAVGACLAQRLPGAAFLRQLAVPRDHRGRGIALALLYASFRLHAERGYPATVLGVDAANATGATRLYERAGMRVVEAFTRWERPGGTAAALPSAP